MMVGIIRPIFVIPCKDYSYDEFDGTIYLVTNYDDTSANIFNPTDLDTLSLDGIFSDQARKIYKSKCKLWKPNNDKMRLICRLEENLRGNEEKNIYLQSIYFIYKNNYNVTINYEAKNIKVKQLNIQLSFLYSDKQTVDLEIQNANSLRFKQDFYDNRPLYLYKDEMRAVELKCESEDKELKCTIPPKEIHEGDEFKAVLSSHHIAPFVFAMTTEKRVTDLLQKYLDESPWLLTTLKEKCI